MGTKFSAQGLVLQVEIAEVMTNIAQCSTVTGPNGEVLFWDATALDSTYVEDGELVDLDTPGETGGTCFFDPDDPGQEQMLADKFAKGVHRDYQLVLPTTGSPAMSFEGSVKTFTVKGSAKGGLEADWAVKLRSPPSLPA